MEIQLSHYPRVMLLVLARVAAVMGTAPFYGHRVPAHIRICMALVVSLALLPALPPAWEAAALRVRTAPDMLLALLSEALLGAAVGLVCQLFVTACLLAGAITGRGSALMMAQSIDPFSGISTQIMAQILQVVFVLLVLLNDGHLALLRLLGASFRGVPPTLGWMNGGVGRQLVGLSAEAFSVGLRLAMPIMAVSLVVNVCFGLIARLAPEFNVLFLSLPVKLLIGLSLFGLLLRHAGGAFGRMIEHMLAHCGRLLV